MEPINFHPGNLALYAKRVLVTSAGTLITYEYGLPHVVYGPGPANGRYWKYVAFETRDAVEMCYWLNSHRVSLPEAPAPESNTATRHQASAELDQAPLFDDAADLL